jgi:hypothetical protein
LISIKSGDLGHLVEVSDQVRFRPDELLVCQLSGSSGEMQRSDVMNVVGSSVPVRFLEK